MHCVEQTSFLSGFNRDADICVSRPLWLSIWAPQDPTAAAVLEFMTVRRSELTAGVNTRPHLRQTL